jgi:hypothetical protein
MKTALALCLAALSFSLVACSKHECSFKTDQEKAAFGTLADMTAGAFNCDVEGVGGPAEFGGETKCEIGAAKCIPKMHALHASPATVKDVAAKYKSFLETAGYKVEEKQMKSKFMNGKDIEGIGLRGTNGDKTVTLSVFPFGTDMVETQTYLGDLK